ILIRAVPPPRFRALAVLVVHRFLPKPRRHAPAADLPASGAGVPGIVAAREAMTTEMRFAGTQNLKESGVVVTFSYKCRTRYRRRDFGSSTGHSRRRCRRSKTCCCSHRRRCTDTRHASKHSAQGKLFPLCYLKRERLTAVESALHWFYRGPFQQ